MRKLTKVLKEKGIIYDEDDFMILMHGAEYDQCQKLVDITETAIITIWYSAVMDPVLKLWDRKTFKPIGQQDLFPMRSFKGNRTWCSFAYEEETK